MIHMCTKGPQRDNHIVPAGRIKACLKQGVFDDRIKDEILQTIQQKQNQTITGTFEKSIYKKGHKECF